MKLKLVLLFLVVAMFTVSAAAPTSLTTPNLTIHPIQSRLLANHPLDSGNWVLYVCVETENGTFDCQLIFIPDMPWFF